MLRTFANALGFFWQASRGYRMRPWRSPYLRWRLETYTGKPAGSLRAKDFFDLLLGEWRQMIHFFRWTGEIGSLAQGRDDL